MILQDASLLDLGVVKWVYMQRGSILKVKIRVYHGPAAVNAIEFHSHSREGEGRKSVFGSTGTKSSDFICIDSTNEYFILISGTTENGVVRSICFMTNLNVYGPYGTNSGTAFSHDVKDGVVVGFHGRAGGIYLNAIGVYVMPKSHASRYSCLVMPRDVGPWGAGGGKAWDDGVFSTIKQVHVHVGELNVIYALQFEYQKRDGKSILSQIHGETDGLEIKMVNLDNHDEFITGISGFYGPVKGYNGLEAIASISFHTNKMIHGPFGEERGAGYVYFCSTPSPGKVVGFHGRNNGFLGAIGVHMEYL
ncbi:putative jacalin-like lectin domain-containing protein [Helianthus annuus]|nr:putative jacalin-like lectin domain-containing protein [Helianthus annuus]